jgi:uncharacterized membrane protein YgcG
VLSLRAGLAIGAVVVVAAGGAGYLTRPSQSSFALPQAAAPDDAKVLIVMPAKTSRLPALAAAPKPAATGKTTTTVADPITGGGGNGAGTGGGQPGTGGGGGSGGGSDEQPTDVGGAD